MPQLIEHSPCARQQGISEQGRLDTARMAVEKSYAQRGLKIGNHLRDRGLRYSELRRGLRHAPMLNNREKQVQVPQRKAPANLAVRIEISRHRIIPILLKEFWELFYIKFDLVSA